jgi:hypothetical protein
LTAPGLRCALGFFVSCMCFLLNNTWCEAVDDIPIHMSTGSTNDISPLFCFHFWEPAVYYKLDDSDFPSDSREKCGHFVGISEFVRHAMTFIRFWQMTLSRLSINPMSDRLLTRTLRTFDLIHWSLATLPRPSSWLGGWWGDFTSDTCHWSLRTYRLYLSHG